MLEMIYKAIQETVKYGIGQSIIAFWAWGYVFILFFVLIYYAILSVIRLIFSRES